MRRIVTRTLAVVAALACLVPARESHAWDPSTTHQALLDEAVRRSDLHKRWMDGSDLQRGVFTAFRVDPDRLDPTTRRLLELAFRLAPADSGAEPLGGPGACPGADAPIETQRYCIAGSSWELDALGWLRLGVLAEAVPAARLQHHFFAENDRAATRWRDPRSGELRTRRRQIRANGAPWAGVLAASSEGSSGNSAIGWLEDASDPLSPVHLRDDLVRAELEPDPEVRSQHVAMALVRAGALLHVVQDAAMPAFARGDKLAFAVPMSSAASDRGAGLQEHTRLRYGRNELPVPHDAAGWPIARFESDSLRALLTVAGAPHATKHPAATTAGIAWAAAESAPPEDGDTAGSRAELEAASTEATTAEAVDAPPETPSGDAPGVDPMTEAASEDAVSLADEDAGGLAHLTGDAPTLPVMGLADFAALHFLSDGQLARATALSDDVDPSAAASVLLASSGLAPSERDGAELRGWPGEAGYLVSGTGRALAAWERDEAGRVRLFLDDVVHREASAWLLPLAADASRVVLDVLWPAFPIAEGSKPTGTIIELDVPRDVSDPALHVVLEDDQGRRYTLQTLALRSGERARVMGLPAAPAGASLVLVFVAQRHDGLPFVTAWTAPAGAGANPGRTTPPAPR